MNRKEEAGLTAAQIREEQDEELEEETSDDDEVDGRKVNVAVDLRRVVREVDVVAVHQMLQKEVHQPLKNIVLMKQGQSTIGRILKMGRD